MLVETRTGSVEKEEVAKMLVQEPEVLAEEMPVKELVDVPEQARDVLAVIQGVFECELVGVVPVKATVVKRPESRPQVLPGLGR
jgi:hypothetical protein